MLTLELHTRDIPAVYGRFAHEIGEKCWKNRVAALKQEGRGNPFLRHLHEEENAVAYQMERLRELQARFRGVAVQAYNDRTSYPAASFAAQVLSVLDASDKVLAERFRNRVRGAFKNPDDMRALRLELTTATHFLRAGRTVRWPEMDRSPEAQGKPVYDLLVEDLGPQGLEIECKSFGQETGRHIGRRRALEFFWQLRSRHWDRMRSLQGGVFAVVTVPRQLPTQHKARLALADAAAKRVLHCSAAEYKEEGALVRIGEFDASQLSPLREGAGPDQMRPVFDELTQTKNKEAFALGTPAGGALLVVVQSAEDDVLLERILRTLKDAASRQFSGVRAALMVAGLDGITPEQLLDIAKHDQDPSAVPTGLRDYASKFLASEGRDQVIGVTFLSSNALEPVDAEELDSGGTAYHFPRRESPFWSEAFEGLVNRK